MPSASTSPALRQRSDYTHSHNRELGRHGWLRLTPAYSVKIVQELLGDEARHNLVLDPFCGTATTALEASYLGHPAVTTEINPFLVWYAGAKLDVYEEADRTLAQQLIERSVCNAYSAEPLTAEVPPLHNIDRWWNAKELIFLRKIKGTFADFGLDTAKRKAENLVKVTFCRTLIFLSNAAFNHQSMSFKNPMFAGLPFSDRIDVYVDRLLEETRAVIGGTFTNPIANTSVVLGDAKDIHTLVNQDVDLVITSPPYPNRMSYIRELRPYMYWLGFLTDAKQASALDWNSIGGTWGTATSNLRNWTANTDYRSPALSDALSYISRNENANGALLANYIAKYFDDMFIHVRSLTINLSPGAKINYIVGNSTFYGTLLSVEELYAEIFRVLGFEDVRIRAIRKRNSKKELIEFCVSATWNG